MTKDVSIINPNNELKKEFFRDADENLSEYQQAMNHNDFLIELFSIATLNSILRLYDTFGDNIGNYGIIKTELKNKDVKYEPILIDHLPY